MDIAFFEIPVSGCTCEVYGERCEARCCLRTQRQRDGLKLHPAKRAALLHPRRPRRTHLLQHLVDVAAEGLHALAATACRAGLLGGLATLLAVARAAAGRRDLLQQQSSIGARRSSPGGLGHG